MSQTGIEPATLTLKGSCPSLMGLWPDSEVLRHDAVTPFSRTAIVSDTNSSIPLYRTPFSCIVLASTLGTFSIARIVALDKIDNVRGTEHCITRTRCPIRTASDTIHTRHTPRRLHWTRTVNSFGMQTSSFQLHTFSYSLTPSGLSQS